MGHCKPTKHNQLRVGDVVRARKRRLQWEVDHFEEMFKQHGKTMEDGRALVTVKSAFELAVYAAALAGMKTKVTVTGWGAEDSEEKPGKRKAYIRVKLTNKVGSVDTIFAERDVWRPFK
jgi:hypothetical protein